MSLLAAVTPSTQPLSGVKRPLQGNPTRVPRNLPAFRGVPSSPGDAIKVPKLSQGNKPNRETNVCIPYPRVCPLEFLSTYCGRLSPGDVAFVQRRPVGYSAPNPGSMQYMTASQVSGSVSRVVGLNGVNRLLHGVSADGGWVEGANVIDARDMAAAAEYDSQIRSGVDPGDAKAAADAERGKEIRGIGDASLVCDNVKGGFRLSVLDAHRLDGVVISNDEPYSFTHNGSRDATIFNLAVQGPTACNNGYFSYESNNGGRGVEAYPRGSQDKELLMRGIPVNNYGSGGFAGTSDFVSSFTGIYTEYPHQMFDRHVEMGNTLYVGLRAFSLSDFWAGMIALQTVESLKETRDADGFKSHEVLKAISDLKTAFKELADADKSSDDAVDATLDALPSYGSMSADQKNAMEERAEAVLTNLWIAPSFMENNASIPIKDLQYKLYYQYMPFSSRSADLAQIYSDAKAAAADDDDWNSTKTKLNSKYRFSSLDSVKYEFDADPYDAVRSVDLEMMVGAWKVGTVTDSKAAKYAPYQGGPSSTGFSLTLNVGICWVPAYGVPGGSSASVNYKGEVTAYEEGGEDRQMQENARRLRRDVFRGSVPSADLEVASAMLAADEANAANPPLSVVFGSLFGKNVGEDGTTMEGKVRALWKPLQTLVEEFRTVVLKAEAAVSSVSSDAEVDATLKKLDDERKRLKDEVDEKAEDVKDAFDGAPMEYKESLDKIVKEWLDSFQLIGVRANEAQKKLEERRPQLAALRAWAEKGKKEVLDEYKNLIKQASEVYLLFSEAKEEAAKNLALKIVGSYKELVLEFYKLFDGSIPTASDYEALADFEIVARSAYAIHEDVRRESQMPIRMPAATTEEARKNRTFQIAWRMLVRLYRGDGVLTAMNPEDIEAGTDVMKIFSDSARASDKVEVPIEYLKKGVLQAKTDAPESSKLSSLVTEVGDYYFARNYPERIRYFMNEDMYNAFLDLKNDPTSDNKKAAFEALVNSVASSFVVDKIKIVNFQAFFGAGGKATKKVRDIASSVPSQSLMDAPIPSSGEREGAPALQPETSSPISTPSLGPLATSGSTASASRPATRRRARDPASASVVSSVFDSIFAESGTSSSARGETPSPTPSSGSESAGAAGPKAVPRRQR